MQEKCRGRMRKMHRARRRQEVPGRGVHEVSSVLHSVLCQARRRQEVRRSQLHQGGKGENHYVHESQRYQNEDRERRENHGGPSASVEADQGNPQESACYQATPHRRTFETSAFGPGHDNATDCDDAGHACPWDAPPPHAKY